MVGKDFPTLRGAMVQLPQPSRDDAPMTFKCKCGRPVTFGYVTRAGTKMKAVRDSTPGSMPTALHEAPECDDFRNRELLDYMAWMRDVADKRLKTWKTIRGLVAAWDDRPPSAMKVDTEGMETPCQCGGSVHLAFGGEVFTGHHTDPICPPFASMSLPNFINWMAAGGSGNGLVPDEEDPSMIPGLLAPKAMACEDCGEMAEYVEGSLVYDCTCMEPEGSHVVRRCPAGHEHASHISGMPLEGQWEHTQDSDESTLRMKFNPEDLSKIDEAAKSSGQTREQYIKSATTMSVNNARCTECGDRLKVHFDDKGGVGLGFPCRRAGCGCKGGALNDSDAVTSDDIAENLDGVLGAVADAAEGEGKKWSTWVAERMSAAPERCRNLFARAMKDMSDKRNRGPDDYPDQSYCTLEQMKKAVGKRSVFEAYLHHGGFVKALNSFRESLAIEGIDRTDFHGMLRSIIPGLLVLGLEADAEAKKARWDRCLTVEIFSMFRLAWAGRREFRLSPAIAESLLLTDVKGMTSDSIRFPYEAFMVRIPPGLVDLRNSEDRRVYPVVSAIAVEWSAPVSLFDPGFETFFTDAPGPRTRAMSIFAMGAYTKESRDVLDSSSLGWVVDLESPEGLQKAKSVVLASGSPSKRKIVEVRSDRGHLNAEAVKLVTRLVLNTCLYVSLPTSDVVLEGQEQLNRLREQARKHPKGSKKGERAREALRQEERKPQVRNVGWSIKVPGAVREAAAHERSAKGRQFTSQWLVRGHWRNQAVGDRVEGKHKVIWIQPHYCRKDLGERVRQAPYRVE